MEFQELGEQKATNGSRMSAVWENVGDETDR